MKKILKWLDNYWYHNKWPTLIALFLIISIGIMTFQFIGKENYDLSIIYAGPFDPTPVQTASIEGEFGKMVKEDFNGDKKKNCQLNNFFLLTEEQLKEKQAEADKNGVYYYADPIQMNNNRQQFTNQVFAGEAIVCLLDPTWYDLLLEQKAFVPLDEILGEVPDYALDEYSVRLKDTAFAKYFTAFNAFPDDTVLCVRTLSTTTAFKNRKEAEEKYEYNKEFFVSLFEFSLGNE